MLEKNEIFVEKRIQCFTVYWHWFGLLISAGRNNIWQLSCYRSNPNLLYAKVVI